MAGEAAKGSAQKEARSGNAKSRNRETGRDTGRDMKWFAMTISF
jgi:hypothetical protein